MPIDGLVVECLASELNRILSGGRIGKVNQPDKYEICIEINSGGANRRLLISADPSLPRVYLTCEKKENPSAAPAFCMLLRKHFRSASIEKVYSVGYDRILFFELSARSELGDREHRNLIVEIMGRHSNIILTDCSGRIIDSIKHVDTSISRFREIMPARPYLPPPSQGKIPVDRINPAVFFNDAKTSAQTVKNYIMSRITGFSDHTVFELTNSTGISPDEIISVISDETLKTLSASLRKLKTMLMSHIFSPCLIFSDSSRTALRDFYCLVLTEDGKRRYNSSISQILDEFYSDKSKKIFLTGRTSSLTRVVRNNITRLKKKEQIHTGNIAAAEEAPLLRISGELLIANLYRLKDMKTPDCVDLDNYYADGSETLRIPLDRSLSFKKNAGLFFKKASKAEAAKEHSLKELKSISSELSYLETVLYHIENAEDIHDIEDLKSELLSQGYVRSNAGRKKPGGIVRAPMPFHYLSSEGYNIFVGKNNVQNDRLTMKSASSRDMWLHAKSYPGSHVLIRYEGKDFSEKVIYEASLLAAYHSRAGSSENVEVDHTCIKNVRRHSGKRPGMVYYTDYRTINVTPDKQTIRKYLRRL